MWRYGNATAGGGWEVGVKGISKGIPPHPLGCCDWPGCRGPDGQCERVGERVHTRGVSGAGLLHGGGQSAGTVTPSGDTCWGGGCANMHLLILKKHFQNTVSLLKLCFSSLSRNAFTKVFNEPVTPVTTSKVFIYYISPHKSSVKMPLHSAL